MTIAMYEHPFSSYVQRSRFAPEAMKGKARPGAGVEAIGRDRQDRECRCCSAGRGWRSRNVYRSAQRMIRWR
jgi:hypothetical protein